MLLKYIGFQGKQVHRKQNQNGRTCTNENSIHFIYIKRRNCWRTKLKIRKTYKPKTMEWARLT